MILLPKHHTKCLDDEVFKSQTVKFAFHSFSDSSDRIIRSSRMFPSLLKPAGGLCVIYFFIPRILICCLVFISAHRSSIFQTVVIFIRSPFFFFISIPSQSLFLPSMQKHISAHHFHLSLWCSHHLWIMSRIKENDSQNTLHRLKSQQPCLCSIDVLEMPGGAQ